MVFGPEELGQPSSPPSGADAGPRAGRYQYAQTTALTVVAAAAIIGFVYFARIVVIVTLVALLIAFMLAPVVDVLHRLRVPRSVGALAATLALSALVWGAAQLSVPRLVDFAAQVPQYTARAERSLHGLTRNARKVGRARAAPDAGVVTVKQARSWSDVLLGSVGSILEALFILGTIPFLVYFMLSWQEHAHTATVHLFRRDHWQQADATLRAIGSLVRAFLLGNVVIGVILAAVSTLIFGALGLPFPYFIGIISGFVSLLPYVGVVLAAVPPLLAGVGQLGTTGIAIIVASVVSLHVFALNVLYPKILGRRVQLNPLAVTIALLFWGWLWGAMGLILAVPLTGAIKIVCDQIERLRPYGLWLGEEAA